MTNPKPPYQRLLDAKVLSPAQAQELAVYKASLNVVAIAQEIDRIQQRLISLAAAPTRRLEREVQDADARGRLDQALRAKSQLAEQDFAGTFTWGTRVPYAGT